MSSQDQPPVHTRVIDVETSVEIGQPANYPTELVAALSRRFDQEKGIRAAYIALMHDRTIDAYPHLLIGIDCADEAFARVSQAAGAVIGAASLQEPVDVMQVKARENGVSRYLAGTAPFFLKK